jgi:hypothetical protein
MQRTFVLGDLSPSIQYASSAFMAALFEVLWGGPRSRRHIGDGQRRAMERARPIEPASPADPAVSRQVGRALIRRLAKAAEREVAGDRLRNRRINRGSRLAAVAHG